jgi:hypothetical protein
VLSLQPLIHIHFHFYCHYLSTVSFSNSYAVGDTAAAASAILCGKGYFLETAVAKVASAGNEEGGSTAEGDVYFQASQDTDGPT